MTLAQGLKVLDLARRIIDGSIIDKVHAAREMVTVALELAPEADLYDYITDAARARADAIADAYEAAKLSDK